MPKESVPYEFWSKAWLANPQLVSLAAGGCAGVVTEAILFPIDAIKTRAQSSRGLDWSGLRSHGCRGLYRGCGVAMAGNVPASAIFFCCYEGFKTKLGVDGQERDVTLRHAATLALASALAESTASTIRVPLDMLKQRMQMGYGTGSLWQASRQSVAAAYRVTLMRDLCHNGLQFPLYEILKASAAKRSSPQGQYAQLQAAACGGVAGFVSAWLTTPFDLLKTRMNLAGHAADPTAVAPQLRRRGAARLLRAEMAQIYAAKGLKGFFAGGGLRAAWMGLGGFIFLGSFEVARAELEEQQRLLQASLDARGGALVHVA